MARPKKFVLPEIAKKFVHEMSVTTEDGYQIEHGDMIKIKGKNSFGVGEWGTTFKFDKLVTNTENGKVWIECFEMYRGRSGVMRAFLVERIKRIPKKRVKKVKNVN
jgi:hypothetical protein